MNKKIISLVAAALLLLPALVSCSGTTDGTSDVAVKNASTITLSNSGVTADSSAVYIEDDLVTISSAGTYIVTGAWDYGQLVVDCVDAGTVTLILDNATITNDDQACIFIKKAQGGAVISLKEGTSNTVIDGSYYTFDDPTVEEPNAAIFSKEDLTITGTGSLLVNANYANGIVSKDNLKIENGTISVTSANVGIKGKDTLKITGGTIEVNAGGDGLKSSNDKTELVGIVEINGGDITVFSDDEAVQAYTKVVVTGGTLNLESSNNGIKTNSAINVTGGTVVVNADDEGLIAPTINVTGGEVVVNDVPYIG